MMKLFALSVLFSLGILFTGCRSEHLSTSLDDVKIITTDIDHFWRAFDKVGENNSDSIFTNEYFNRGTSGLRDFIDLRIGDVQTLTKDVQKRHQYYASIRENTLKVDSLKPQILQSFSKLKEIYPAAKFPDVYFLIGVMNSGGTTSSSGLLIGTELYSKSELSPTDSLDRWTKEHTFPLNHIPFLVAHELAHIQQQEAGILSRILSGAPLFNLTLLEKCLNEGGADFVGELISGSHINQEVHRYAENKEKEIWDSFKLEMNGTDYSRWLFNPNLSDRPADLGYYVGYKICQAHYNKATDKRLAVADILNITNAQDFLERSEYESRFK